MSRIRSAFSPSRNLRHLLVRPPDNVAALDGYRAISVVLVMLFHVFLVYVALQPGFPAVPFMLKGGVLTGFVWNGDKGVDVFFVISGFLITTILLKQIERTGKVALGNFYLRRFARLSPAYWVALALYAT